MLNIRQRALAVLVVVPVHAHCERVLLEHLVRIDTDLV